MARAVGKGGAKIDIDYWVDRLEELLLDRSRRIPFTSKTIVDGDEYLHLIDQIRISVPKEITEAQRVLQEQDQIIARAREEAANIVALAQEQRDRLVGEHELLRRAEVEREKLLERARQEAARIAAEADAYALEVLRELEQQLNAFQKTVRNGIALLEGQRTAKEEKDPEAGS